ncbi:hypothetical protein ACWEQA_23610 [Nocardia sp. NPDC004085]
MPDRYGVLLPLRLETRFIPPFVDAAHPDEPAPDAPSSWRLRLRVVPDDAFIDEHHTEPTDAEIAHVQALWDTLHPHLNPIPADPAARLARAATDDGWADAFGRVAAATGAARAHWLLTVLDVQTGRDGRPHVSWPGGSPATSTHPRIVGLPGKLEVWVVWHGADAGPDTPAPSPEVIGRLEPELVTDSLDLDALLSDQVPDREQVPENDRPWWTSWESATNAGLAAEITLPRHPKEIEVLGVSGLGAKDGTTPRDLFRAHTAAGRFVVLRPGVATSTVFGAGTVDTEQHTHWSDPAPATDPAAHEVLRTLTGSTDIGPVPTDPLLGQHQRLSSTIVAACYPALWGYGLSGVLGIPHDIDQIAELWNWALRWVRPEGNHPPIRIGDQVYGVLPLAVPTSDLAAGVTAVPSPQWQAATPILPALGRITRRWAHAAESRLSGTSDHGPDAAARPLRHGPIPTRLWWQPLIPVILDAALNHTPPRQALDTWWNGHPDAGATRTVLGLDEAADTWIGRAYAARHQRFPLEMPLIGKGLDTPESADNDAEALHTWLEHSIAEFTVDDVEVALPRQREDRSIFVDSLLLTLYLRSRFVTGQLLWISANGSADPAHRLPLLEPLATTSTWPRAAGQTHDFLNTQHPPHLPPPLLLAAGAGGRTLEDLHGLIDTCREEPALRLVATRALRATIDAASGRWDPWLAGIGAAHAADALDGGAEPTLGAYGWVDHPYRGTPGPGPGGFLLAPSQTQAATLAVLRDRAVHDPDPARYAMNHTTAQTAQAQRWLTDIAAGWHPAELTGRHLERLLTDNNDLTEKERAELLRKLRSAAPLRANQGGFGCTHGLDVLHNLRNGTPGPWSAPAVVAAAQHLNAVLDAAADLLLADGVHGFLTARPARAAAAVRALAGKTAPGPLPVLDPDRPSLTVHTCILAALPAAPTVPDPPGQQVGPACIAAPALNATLRHCLPQTPRWDIDLGNGPQQVTSADLGCGPLDIATLENHTALAAARLAVVAGRGTPLAEAAEAAPPLDRIRAWTRSLHGRPSDITDLAPSQIADDAHDPSEAAIAARQHATTVLLDRIRTVEAAATALAHELSTAHTDYLEDESDRVRAAESGQPVPDLPGGALDHDQRRRFADLAVRAAAWALNPPDCASTLVGADLTAAHRARADLAAFLGDSATRLQGRIKALRAHPTIGKFLHGAPTTDLMTDPVTAAAALAELVGRPELPISVPLPLESALGPEPGGPELTEWARTVTVVRPGLEHIVDTPPTGLHLFATNPADPWRTSAVAAAQAAAHDHQPVPPPPRLTVILAPVAPTTDTDFEWITLDAYAEAVPASSPMAGAAFDTATPSASPPQAVLLTPVPIPGSSGPSHAELRALVCYARTLAHGRTADRDNLTKAGLGPLTTFAALPQDELSGAPLHPQARRATPTPDLPAVLIPQHDDSNDVLAAVTADALWMLGAQWALGEHAGDDAATPLWIETTLTHTPIHPSTTQPERDPRTVPVEACLEGDPHETALYPLPATLPEHEHSTWHPADLTYSATFPVGTDGPAASLTIDRHNGGPTGWWATTSDRPIDSTPPEPDQARQRFRPGRLDWPGQPRGRYWQIEHPHHDPAGDGPDLTQPATLHLIDILSQHGDDIYIAPLPAHPGTVLRPGSRITMTDAAGGTWTLQSPTDWSLLRVDQLDPPPPDDDPDHTWHPATVILLGADAALTGPLRDDIALTIDEDDNLVWAAELRIDGTEPEQTHPTPQITTPPEDNTQTPTWSWDLGGRIRSHRHPYLHESAITNDANGPKRDTFIQAQLSNPDPPPALVKGPVSEPLKETPRLNPLAIPASGIRLTRQPILARTTTGQPVLWLRRTTRPLDTTVDIDLRWDVLDRNPPA